MRKFNSLVFICLLFFSWQMSAQTISLPYLEDFEAGDGGYIATGTSASWAHGVPQGTAIPSTSDCGGSNAWVTNLTGNYNNNEDSQLESPMWDFTGLTKDPVLRFDHNFVTEGCCDEGWVEFSTDNGASWTKLGSSSSGGLNWYNDGSNDWWDGSSNGWRIASHTLTGLAGQDSIKIRFAFSSDGSAVRDGFAVDNIVIDTAIVDPLLSAFVQPGSTVNPFTATETIEVSLTNGGTDTLRSVQLCYVVDNGTPVCETFNILVASAASSNLSFTQTADLSVVGSHVVDVYIGTTNLFACNDTISINLTTTSIINSFPYIEDFEANDGDFVATGSSSSWAHGVPAGSAITSSQGCGTNAWVTNLTGNYNNNEASFIESPTFDFSSLTTDPLLRFDLNYVTEACCDEGWVEYSTNGGNTWSKLGTNASGGINWYNDAGNDWWDGSSNGWVIAAHPLTGLAGQSNVKIRFAFDSDGSAVRDGFAIDNIIIDTVLTDPSVAALVQPGATVSPFTSTETIEVAVVNAGTSTLNSIQLCYNLDNGTPVCQTFTINLTPAQADSLTFTQTADLSVVGAHTLDIYVGSTNDYTCNDTLSLSLTTTNIINTFPYLQDFEANDGNFSSSGASNTWAYGVPAGTAISSSSGCGTNAWVTNLTGNYNNNEDSYLESPTFDFSSFTTDPILRFDHNFITEGCCDEGWVEFSINGGTTWSKLGSSASGLANWYNDAANEWWDGTSNGWRIAAHSLTGLAGQSNVKIRFAFSSDGSAVREGFAVDNILIGLTLDDPTVDNLIQPAFLSGQYTSTETVEIGIANAGTTPVTSIQLCYVLDGGTPVCQTFTGNIMPTAISNFAFTQTADLSVGGPHTLQVYIASMNDYVCNDTTTFNITSITCPDPTTLTTSSILDTSAIISWTEAGMATQWEIEYDTTGFTQGTGNTMIVNTTSRDTLTGLTPQTGYTWYVRAICAPGDTSNWIGGSSFTTLCSPFSVPFLENFATFTPNCWEEAGSGDPRTGPSGLGNGLWNGSNYLNAAVNGTGFKINLFTDNREDWVLSPIIDLSTTGGPYELRIEAGLTDFNGTTADNMGSDDTVQVLVSANGGAKWDVLYTWDVNNQPPTAGNFYRIDLSAYTGPSNLFAIWAKDGPVNDPEDYDFHIGSFEVRTVPNCLAPTNNPILAIGPDSIDISWIENGVATNWEIQVDTVGFPAGSGNSTMISVDTFATISGLMDASSYEYYIRTVCGRGDTSAWAGPVRFNTECLPFTAPYMMSFDAASTGDLNNSGIACWRATGPGANDVDISTTTDQGVPVPSAPNAVELNDGTWPNDSAILVSPRFSDLTSGLNRIRFQAAFESTSATSVNMYVGVMTDPDDAATFVAIDTIDASDVGGSTNFGEVIVNLDNTTLIGTAEYVAIAHGVGAFEAYVDDFNYEVIPANDLSVTAIVRPTSLCGVTMDSVEVVISNVGSASQSNFMVGFSVDGVAATPETFTGTIAPGASANFVFNGLATLTAGATANIQAYSLLATDVDLTNDTSATLVTSFSNVATFPYNESFEAGNGSWSATGNASWELGVPANTIIDTASDGTQAWVTSLTGQYGNNELGFVESPCFDFSSIADPFIELDIWYEAENSFDGAALQSSIDGGATWQLVGAQNDTINWYNDGSISGISGAVPSQEGWTNSPGTGGWITAKHYLDNLGNFSNVRLRMVFGSDGSATREGVAFDNIKIFDNPRPCFAPTALDSRNIMPTSADLAWTDNNNISSWEISYGAPNFTAGSGTQILVNTNPFNLTNLTQGTDYEWYIRAICGPGDTSVWSDTAAFRTILPTVPYYPVGTINTQDATTGVADSMGVACNTSGIVVGVDLDGNGGYVFTIIDMASGNQEGIGIFNSSDVDGYVVNQGDSVMIRGSVSQFNGLTQLSSIDSITVIATGVTLPTPIVVDFPSEGTESKWIQINNATAVTASGAQGSNNNQTFSRNGVNFTLRVDRDTDVDDSLAVFPLAIGDSLCQVIGIGGQFDSSNPFTAGYQILPTRYADLDTSACSFVVGIEDTQLEEKAFVLVPNPTSGLFEIRTNGFQNETINLIIRDLSGRIIENQIISNANSAFQRAFDLESNAKGIYFISIQDGESIINEKLILH